MGAAFKLVSPTDDGVMPTFGGAPVRCGGPCIGAGVPVGASCTFPAPPPIGIGCAVGGHIGSGFLPTNRAAVLASSIIDAGSPVGPRLAGVRGNPGPPDDPGPVSVSTSGATRCASKSSFAF